MTQTVPFTCDRVQYEVTIVEEETTVDDFLELAKSATGRKDLNSVLNGGSVISGDDLLFYYLDEPIAVKGCETCSHKIKIGLKEYVIQVPNVDDLTIGDFVEIAVKQTKVEGYSEVTIGGDSVDNTDLFFEWAEACEGETWALYRDSSASVVQPPPQPAPPKPVEPAPPKPVEPAPPKPVEPAPPKPVEPAPPKPVVMGSEDSDDDEEVASHIDRAHPVVKFEIDNVIFAEELATVSKCSSVLHMLSATTGRTDLEKLYFWGSEIEKDDNVTSIAELDFNEAIFVKTAKSENNYSANKMYIDFWVNEKQYATRIANGSTFRILLDEAKQITGSQGLCKVWNNHRESVSLDSKVSFSERDCWYLTTGSKPIKSLNRGTTMAVLAEKAIALHGCVSVPVLPAIHQTSGSNSNSSHREWEFDINGQIVKTDVPAPGTVKGAVAKLRELTGTEEIEYLMISGSKLDFDDSLEDWAGYGPFTVKAPLTCVVNVPKRDIPEKPKNGVPQLANMQRAFVSSPNVLAVKPHPSANQHKIEFYVGGTKYNHEIPLTMTFGELLEYAKKVSDHDELATGWVDGLLVDLNDAVFELCDVDSYAIDFRPPLLKK